MKLLYFLKILKVKNFMHLLPYKQREHNCGQFPPLDDKSVENNYRIVREIVSNI